MKADEVTVLLVQTHHFKHNWNPW